MSQITFQRKTAFVTGAASGIGLAITRQLLENGSTVVGADLNEDRLKELEVELGSSFNGKKLDVTKEAEHEEVISSIVKEHGKLDFAFNVAGANKSGTITDLSLDDWNFTVDLILNGVFLGMKHQARQMKKQEHGGSIVNVSSLNAHVPMYTGSAYASAKAGVEMLTKNGALELARDNIKVNAILPGLVNTPLVDDFKSEEIFESFMERIPMKRAAEPEEVAKPALFLVSEGASYINGASLLVDGAWAVSGYPDLSKFF
ncbi:SDR family NAD(P)-dependent oxidoreductase [Oceanobacillus manasiensis]|uniref:SDR family NAD(P)-dependent oxidoreductase n=1 Tax=Oceanobacillus manasiensis TaxID=586413 RepID=UPI0005A6E4F4|nr:SDR family oxidoreductase [Oceanobacillus manasiensis]